MGNALFAFVGMSLTAGGIKFAVTNNAQSRKASRMGKVAQGKEEKMFFVPQHPARTKDDSAAHLAADAVDMEVFMAEALVHGWTEEEVRNTVGGKAAKTATSGEESVEALRAAARARLAERAAAAAPQAEPQEDAKTATAQEEAPQETAAAEETVARKRGSK